jgi:hypothetical protein
MVLKMTDDLWVFDFAKRATVRLRLALGHTDDGLPLLLVERLEQLRRAEESSDGGIPRGVR